MKGVLLGGALAVVGVFVGFALATTTGISIEGKLWEIVSACGTVGAVVVALGWNYLEARKERKNSVLRAQLQANSLSRRIPQVSGTLRTLVRFLTRKRVHLTHPNVFRDRFLNSLEACDLITIDDAVALAAAPEDCAVQVSELIGNCHALRKVLAMSNTNWSSVLGFAEHALGNAAKAQDVCLRCGNWR